MQQPEWTPETEHQYELAIGRIKHVQAATVRHRRHQFRDMRWFNELDRLDRLDARYWSDANKLLLAAGVTRYRDRDAILKQALKTKLAASSA